MRRVRTTILCIAMIALVAPAIGLWYFHHADWWAYYHDGGRRVPVFEVSRSWRVVESGIVGFVSAAVPVTVMCAIVAIRRKNRRGFPVIQRERD